jgi:transcriptional regulator with XRE-family HTH domain
MLWGMDTAAAVLRDARRRAGLSQVELGRRAGVTQSVVSAYESGARQPSLPMLARLVGATGLELDIRLSEPEAAGLASGLLA